MTIAVCANADGSFCDDWRFLRADASVGDTRPAEYTIRFSTDGSAPTLKSPAYQQPVSQAAKLQAAIFVKDQLVLAANAQTNAASTAGNGTGTVSVVKQ